MEIISLGGKLESIKCPLGGSYLMAKLVRDLLKIILLELIIIIVLVVSTIN